MIPARKEISLDLVQRWFQAVITHAGGAEEGVLAAGARELIALHSGEVENVIRRSANQTALERLSIYAGAYYARLLECMGGCFPVLKQTLGDEVFDGFAFEYLQQYPSHSYTLDLLGEQFCSFLKETRPDQDELAGGDGWPDFLIDLATLEWTIGRVFDGAGPETRDLLTPEVLESFPVERFAEARLELVQGLELLTFRFPVNAYYTAVRRAGESEETPIPQPVAEQIAVFRRNFVVRRFSLTEPQFFLLQSLQTGATAGDAIAAAAARMNLDDESVAASLRSWFRFWSREGLFAAICLQ